MLRSTLRAVSVRARGVSVARVSFLSASLGTRPSFPRAAIPALRELSTSCASRYDADRRDSASNSRDRVLPGDWTCPSCNINNFARRTQCMKCGGPSPNARSTQQQRISPGDWECSKCQTHNFARRTYCWKCKEPSSEPRPDRSVQRTASRGATFREGDWKCEQCSAHNFARRSQCWECGANSNRERVTKPGDWVCGGCGFFNFNGRHQCLRCKADAPADQATEQHSDADSTASNAIGNPQEDAYSSQENSEGDWICGNCNSHNYTSRSSCRTCAVDRKAANERAVPSPPAEDWSCTDCGIVNRRTNYECWRCHTNAPFISASGDASATIVET